MGWDGIKNGELLQKMHSKSLEVLISIDKNMSHQQNLEKYHVSLIVLDSKDSRYTSLVKFMPKIERLLDASLQPGLIMINK